MADEQEAYLLVQVAGQLCALPAARVSEVCRVPPLSARSRAVPSLRGTMLLRGELVPMLDMSVLLGFACGEDAPETTRAVSLRLAGGAAALLVQEVIGLRHLRREQIQAIALPGGRPMHVGGFDDEFAQCIDLAGLVPDELWDEIRERGTA